MADRDLDRMIDDETEFGRCVVVRTPVSKRRGVWLPDPDGKDVLTTCFGIMTLEDNMAIEELCFETKTDERGADISSVNPEDYRMLVLRRLLLLIDDFRPERRNGWMVKGDWDRIKRYNGTVISHVATQYEARLMLSEDDDRVIKRQASILFGTDNAKVMNPHPGISAYCNLSGLWDKFGIDPTKAGNMDIHRHAVIRSIMGCEGEQMRARMKR